MNILFLHQNMPGQFKHLAPALARNPAHRVVFLTQRDDVTLPGVQRVLYKPTRKPHVSTHHYIQTYEAGVLNGQAVVRAGLALQKEGFRPDLIVAHPGWGESLFIKDVFPHAPLLSYCEFYYHGRGGDVDFGNPDVGLDSILGARARNAHLLLSLECCDFGISPTHWQRDTHPSAFRSKISVVFDGIDTRMVQPNDQAAFTLPDGRILRRTDDVVTYVGRSLEPYRGFPTFMRALPALLARRPEAHIVIVGGDGVSYGRGPGGEKTWRQVMTEEVGGLDFSRVHFVGRLPYSQYLAVLQISTVHAYLTVPFVLSWSCFEAMAAGGVVVGSSTPPVQEVISDGHNGFLVDFHDAAAWADKLAECLERRDTFGALRARARETILQRYDLAHCLPAQVRLIQSLL